MDAGCQAAGNLKIISVYGAGYTVLMLMRPAGKIFWCQCTGIPSRSPAELAFGLMATAEHSRQGQMAEEQSRLQMGHDDE